ncbi:MAG: hypothetical protein ACREUU_07570, partial [Gammaproteobacteria bacterium]
VFGSRLTNVTGIVTATTLPLPTELNGTSVLIGGVAVPLLAVANVNGQEQVNFFVPFGPSGQTNLVVVNNGVRSVPVQFGLSARFAHPGIFLVDSTNAAIQHGADFRLVSAESPAIPGEAIVIYATGLGDVQPRPATGSPASASPLSRTVMTPIVTVGGIAAEVLFSGLAPGFVGLYQVNIRVPENAPAGELDLSLRVGEIASNVVKLPVR